MDARLGAIRVPIRSTDRSGGQPVPIACIRSACGGAWSRSGVGAVVGVLREPCSNGVQEAPPSFRNFLAYSNYPTPQTVLITGASSGIGLATAALFRERGWNVVATMRNPNRSTQPKDDGAHYVQLDVTDVGSIKRAVATTHDRFGGIDVLVNNAGFGLFGPFEPASVEQIERQFATNVFGLMAVTRELLPHFRERRRGTIVNVASMGGRLAFPLFSVYHATKWAVEGFSESLQYELASFGVRVKLVEPGAVRTDFYGRSASVVRDATYAAIVDRVLPRLINAGTRGIAPERVARVIYRAATNQSRRLRYPVGPDARMLLFLRRVLPDWCIAALIRVGMYR